jgi:hypothetical protein
MTESMPGTTSFAAFLDAASNHRVVPVARELFADGETPITIYRKLANGRPGTFLLESAERPDMTFFIRWGGIVWRAHTRGRHDRVD